MPHCGESISRKRFTRASDNGSPAKNIQRKLSKIMSLVKSVSQDWARAGTVCNIDISSAAIHDNTWSGTPYSSPGGMQSVAPLTKGKNISLRTTSKERPVSCADRSPGFNRKTLSLPGEKMAQTSMVSQNCLRDICRPRSKEDICRIFGLNFRK